ncbi:MAG: tetratricopeptide repeat protein [Elusimicrobia bacterium]|nr:tetratricopeptide repeat protein [Elusimicrobiota bacterium]
MSHPNPEGLAHRVRPVRHGGVSLYWLGTKTLWALAAFSLLSFLAVLYLVFRDLGLERPKTAAVYPPPQIDTAIAQAQDKLKADPQDLAALVELGSLHFEQGKDHYVEAINELEEARDLGALDARIFYCLGTMYQEVGLYPFALEEYKRFLRHFPNDREVRMLLAKLLYKQGRFPEAVAEYERLKFHYPKDSLILENFGLSLWAAKALGRALEAFSGLKAMGPEEAKRASFYIGQIHYEQEQYKQALEQLLQCRGQAGAPGFGIQPEKIYAALAMTYQKLGDLASAKEAWEMVLSQTPNDSKAQVAFKDVERRLSRAKKSAKKT